jgi:hypothetical protein
MNKYSCKFLFGEYPYFTIVPDIGSVKDGFWIDAAKEFTKGSSGVYWIPPSAVCHVEKIKNET